MIGIAGDKVPGRRDHRRKAALHVRRPAPIQMPGAYFGLKRITAPCLKRPGRHHIGMPGKDKQRPAAPVRQPEVIDLRETQPGRAEPRLLQPLGDQPLTTGISGRDRAALDQLNRELECLCHQSFSEARPKAGQYGLFCLEFEISAGFKNTPLT